MDEEDAGLDDVGAPKAVKIAVGIDGLGVASHAENGMGWCFGFEKYNLKTGVALHTDELYMMLEEGWMLAGTYLNFEGVEILVDEYGEVLLDAGVGCVGG